MVECLLEAQKREAYSAEARNQDLDMAEWCISRAIAEGGPKPTQHAGAAAKPNCAPGLIPIFLVMAGLVPATRGSLHAPLPRDVCVPRPE